MSAALQLFFALLWWIVVAALAACLGLATLVVCVTIVDRWRDRQQCRAGTRGPERPPVGKPPASLTVHTSSGKRTLTPIKRTRAVDAAGPMTGGDHSDERKSY